MPIPISQEPVWLREFTPPALEALAVRLRARYRVGPAYIGSKGDENHLRGYHRSREWVKGSIYCTNRTYSVTETPGNRSGGDDRWICAMDIGGIPPAELYAMCRRLDAAMRAGLLDKVTEFFGTFDGRTVVGYNTIYRRSASADSSHLFHGHLSLDRGRANEDHTDLYEILTGEEMTPEEHRWAANVDKLNTALLNGQDTVFAVVWSDGSVHDMPLKFVRDIAALGTAVAGIQATLTELVAHAGVPADQIAAVKAAAESGARHGAEGAAPVIAEAVRPVVDSELDEAFKAGADNDADS